MSLVETLESKRIHPQFWPPLDEHGNAAVRWRGRQRGGTRDSFAAYKASCTGKRAEQHFVSKHVKKSKR